MSSTPNEKAQMFGVDLPDDGDEGTPESEPWQPPTPIAADPVPEFPTSCLPAWQRDFVEAEAEATQTPADLGAMLVLTVTATAMAKRAVVQVRAGWEEPLNIYTVTALGVGERKSAVFADVTRPILAFEHEEALRLAPEIAETRTRLSILNKELAAKERSAATAEDNNQAEGFTQSAVALSKLIELTGVVVAPRLIADDTTPERLAALMSEHGGRMAVLSAEGEIFEQMAGKYQKGVPALNIFLKGHSGDVLRVDRVGRPPDHIDAPALTIGLAVQPSVLEGLAGRAGFRGRGLVARVLYSVPESRVGRRNVNATPMPIDVRAAYHDNMHTLLRLSPVVEDMPHIITLTPDAVTLINEFAEILEPSLAEYGQFGFMADWAGKLTGAIVRIAGLLHAADCVAQEVEPWTQPIDAGIIKRAREIGEYLLLHARAALRSMEAGEEVREAQWILGIIRRKEWQHFTTRDAHRASGAHFRNASALTAPIQLLDEHGYIRKRLAVQQTTGRPPSPTYDVNPMTHDGHR